MVEEKSIGKGAAVAGARTEKGPAETEGHLRPGWTDVRKILVVRLDNIGDVIMTGPALRAVKRAAPDIVLTLMASPAGTQAARLLSCIDEVITLRTLWQDLGALPFDPHREWEMIRDLGRRQFDAAIVLTSFSQSPFPAGLACLLAGIPLRAGVSREGNGDIFTTMPAPLPHAVHQVERNLHLVRSLGYPAADTSLYVEIDDQSRASAGRLLLEGGLRPAEPYILLNPWASAQARTYPADRFGKAAHILSGYTGLRIVVTGGPRERAYAEQVSSALGSTAVDLVGLTTIPELAALVDNAILVLTQHTSVMHLADALKTPQVVLFSGTDLASQWAPRTTPHVLLTRPAACSPCYTFRCPELTCLDIPPEEVALAGLHLLERTSPDTARGPALHADLGYVALSPATRSEV